MGKSPESTSKLTSKEDFIRYTKSRQTLKGDFTGEMGYWGPEPYLEDVRMVMASELSSEEKLEVLRLMNGMSGVLGNDAIDEVSGYEDQLKKEIDKD